MMDLSSLSPEQRAQIEEKLKNMSPEEIAKLQQAQATQQSIFRRIVAGEIPSKKVYEDTSCMAILDIKPASKGHMLVLSKGYFAVMPQVPDEELGHLMKVSKKLSLAALKGGRAAGSTFFVANGAAAGQRVQDFMMHVIPRREGDEVFTYFKQLVDVEKRRALRSLIAAKISVLTGNDDPMPDEESSGESSSGDSLEEVSKGSQDVEETTDAEDESEDIDEDQEDDSEDETDEEDVEESDDVPSRQGSSQDVDLDDIANLFT